MIIWHDKKAEQIFLEDGTAVAFIKGQEEDLVVIYHQQEEAPLYLSKKDLEDMLKSLEKLNE